MTEEDIQEIKARMDAFCTSFITFDFKLNRLESKLDKLIPEIRDVSKHLAEAKQTANKGKKPRKQPKKKDKCTCVDCGAELEIDTEEDMDNTLRCPECYEKMEKESSL